MHTHPPHILYLLKPALATLRSFGLAQATLLLHKKSWKSRREDVTEHFLTSSPFYKPAH